jgi:hypothetical protein
MKNSKSRGNNPIDRFEQEVAQLMRDGVSKARAEQIVQSRAEGALRQGWGMGPGPTRRSEGNKTGGGGRSAHYKSSGTSPKPKKK